MADFRKQLPRLAELHDRFVSPSADNFFKGFPRRLSGAEVTIRFYTEIEKDLSFIPPSEWPGYTDKVGRAATNYNLKHHRYWEELHDLFNEAMGARVLVEKHSCDTVRMIPVGNHPVPDWFGSAADATHLLEVKTANHSAEERESWSKEGALHTCCLPAPLVKKLKSGYSEAKQQLDSVPDASRAKKLVLFVVNVDYNVDSLDNTVASLLQQEFSAMEDPKYFIHYATRCP